MKKPDWEAIEADYRAGILSVREIYKIELTQPNKSNHFKPLTHGGFLILIAL